MVIYLLYIYSCFTLFNGIYVCYVVAFLALQTEVLDFNNDLDVIGIPFWDFKMYAFKLLFPTVGNHPILYPNRNVSDLDFLCFLIISVTGETMISPE